MFIWICLFVVIGLVWYYNKWKFSYLQKLGVNHLPPDIFFGNMTKIMFKREHFSDFSFKLYFAFPNDRVVGTYDFTKPGFFVRDLELIKCIGVKDFDHFCDRQNMTGDEDPVFSKGLIGLKGDKWRDMRSTLSPAFTGSKLRNMIPFMITCSKQMSESLKSQVNESKDDYFDLDVKDLCSRYANDVIATCAFGIDVNSIKERNNEFYKMGQLLTAMSFVRLLKISVLMSFPFLKKIMTSNLVSLKACDFLGDIIYRTMKHRKQTNINRPDLIQILMEAKEGSLKHEKSKDNTDAGFATVQESSIGKGTIRQVWDDEDLVAQALLFFFAGFDTISTAMTFLLHELAANPDIQDRLVEEIIDYDQRYQEKLDYDKISQMKYMDMVISETLRKWPPALLTDRACVKRYNLGKPNDKTVEDLVIKKGAIVGIPIWCIHRDPQYYPDPDKFYPERFSDENKSNINPLAYLPFGIGPRNCIGSRFALIEIKTMTFHLLRQFEVSPSSKTQLPIKFDKKEFIPRIAGGHTLRFRLRDLS